MTTVQPTYKLIPPPFCREESCISRTLRIQLKIVERISTELLVITVFVKPIRSTVSLGSASIDKYLSAIFILCYIGADRIMKQLIKFGFVVSSSLALLFLPLGAKAQVAASSSQANPFSSNLNNNTNSSTVYNVLPANSGASYQSDSNTTVISLTLSFGWSETYVYPAAPTTCPIAISSNDVLTTRIPLGCPIPAVLTPQQLNQAIQQPK
ncbi:MAG: hypothetical protein Q8T09_11490 [Candidatus Melainabacteria bacterium]|nr:hypothetical protein [Candidatus Melainabacteria bacterium]